ncbi:MAG: hypothetical protein IT460_05425 [Planctomycetes bacterium]|nr:hypothetical protein [Planctomycetota bacterium]
MDPYEKFLRRPLDEVLVAQGVLNRETADQLRESAEAAGEPFATAVLDSGALTPWDLARLIAVHYQIPVHPLTGFKFGKELFEGTRADLLHRYQFVPVGVFGATRTFAVLEPPPRSLVEELRGNHGENVFFFVSESTEIARALSNEVKVVDTESDRGWQKLFDSAEAEISRNGEESTS